MTREYGHHSMCQYMLRRPHGHPVTYAWDNLNSESDAAAAAVAVGSQSPLRMCTHRSVRVLHTHHVLKMCIHWRRALGEQL